MPVIAIGSGFTVIAFIVVQPDDKVYVMLAVPLATPVANPLDSPIVQTDVALLLQVPPEIASPMAIVNP